MICLAKGLASGMPLGAIVANADLMNWPSGSHASTFGGNPVCCRAALATIDLLEREYMANATPPRPAIAGWPAPARGPRANLGPAARTRANGRRRRIKGRPSRPATTRRDRRSGVPPRAVAVGVRQSRRPLLPGLCVTAEQIESALEILAAACVNAHEV